MVSTKICGLRPARTVTTHSHPVQRGSSASGLSLYMIAYTSFRNSKEREEELSLLAA
ncbi:hypothetical protein PROFUN_10933 [Planoprotostelium fungivorum]|uniref:Uncharacterized protein n=1 Tax=Planoprotostelium fungivorum TaxID=1890364 RepID=A0A2P6NC33_9EUKA|nr:hypothetical protein PROFUN_10933 [Planoprotostelium fungivorum]